MSQLVSQIAYMLDAVMSEFCFVLPSHIVSNLPSGTGGRKPQNPVPQNRIPKNPITETLLVADA